MEGAGTVTINFLGIAMKTLLLIIITTMTLSLTACSSKPPPPPEPVGEFTAVNPSVIHLQDLKL